MWCHVAKPECDHFTPVPIIILGSSEGHIIPLWPGCITIVASSSGFQSSLRDIYNETQVVFCTPNADYEPSLGLESETTGLCLGSWRCFTSQPTGRRHRDWQTEARRKRKKKQNWLISGWTSATASQHQTGEFYGTHFSDPTWIIKSRVKAQQRLVFLRSITKMNLSQQLLFPIDPLRVLTSLFMVQQQHNSLQEDPARRHLHHLTPHIHHKPELCFIDTPSIKLHNL